MCRRPHRVPVLPGRQPPELRADARLPAGEPNLNRHMRRVRDSRSDRAASLPAVGTLVNEPAYAGLVKDFGRARVVDAIREQIAAERDNGNEARERVAAVETRLRTLVAPRMRRGVNAAGGGPPPKLRGAPLSVGGGGGAGGGAGGQQGAV